MNKLGIEQVVIEQTADLKEAYRIKNSINRGASLDKIKTIKNSFSQIGKILIIF